MTDCLKLAVFDCDGTLVDSQHVIASAMRAAFEAAGRPAPGHDRVRRVVGLNLEVAIAALAPDAPDDCLADMVNRFKRTALALRHRPDYDEPLFDGAADALGELAEAGWVLGIATGKARRGLDVTLARHGLGGHFVTLQTPDTNPGKPHPGMLHAAMRETGASAHRTVMIGDTSYDIDMARRAGTRAVGVGWGYHEPGALIAGGAHAVAGRFRDLPGLLHGMMKGGFRTIPPPGSSLSE